MEVPDDPQVCAWAWALMAQGCSWAGGSSLSHWHTLPQQLCTESSKVCATCLGAALRSAYLLAAGVHNLFISSSHWRSELCLVGHLKFDSERSVAGVSVSAAMTVGCWVCGGSLQQTPVPLVGYRQQLSLPSRGTHGWTQCRDAATSRRIRCLVRPAGSQPQHSRRTHVTCAATSEQEGHAKAEDSVQQQEGVDRMKATIGRLDALLGIEDESKQPQASKEQLQEVDTLVYGICGLAWVCAQLADRTQRSHAGP